MTRVKAIGESSVILAAVLCCVMILAAAPMPAMADDSQDAQNYREAVQALKSNDYETAAKLLLPLAEKGHAYSQHLLGRMYLGGSGVPKDDQKAAEWQRKAAEQGLRDAQFILGALYWEGRGVPKDLTQSAIWMRQAAEQGHSQAQYLYGVMRLTGKGVPQELVQAYMWLSLADAQKVKAARKQLDKAATHMTPEQIDKAKSLAAKRQKK
jgi:hypothetical protein